MGLTLFLIEDDDAFSHSLAGLLGHQKEQTADGNRKKEPALGAGQLSNRRVLDFKLTGERQLQLFADLLRQSPPLRVVVLTGQAAEWAAEELAATPVSVERLEWEHIQRVLKEHNGNISATARALNMHRRTLQRKLHKRAVQPEP